MTHEPECQLVTWGVPVPTCTCAAIRTAYQRGRKEATRDNVTVVTATTNPQEH